MGDGVLCEEIVGNRKYVYTGGASACDTLASRRVDATRTTSVVIRSLFLPEGYPHTVSGDYMWFQAWDTVQALCSYVRGILCTQALLTGVGVGDAEKTATSAALTWVMRDGAGMLGSMTFAWLQGSQFDSDAKKWRLFADVINDLGLALELLSPMFPEFFLVIVCIASVAKSLCGVAGGATRAALMQHFALNQNYADVAAKDGSQETATSLAGLILGSFFTHQFADESVGIVWMIFVLLTGLHVTANYLALKGLEMTSLNGGRMRILVKSYMNEKKTLTPKEVAILDSILLFPLPSPSILVGASPSNLQCSADEFKKLRHIYGEEAYMVSVNMRKPDSKYIYVILQAGCSREDILKAYFNSVCVALRLDGSSCNILQVLDDCCRQTSSAFPAFMQETAAAGWDTSFPLFGQCDRRVVFKSM